MKTTEIYTHVAKNSFECVKAHGLLNFSIFGCIYNKNKHTSVFIPLLAIIKNQQL